MKIKELFETADKLIVAGQIEAARDLILEVDLNLVERQQFAGLATLYRRIARPELVLKLLTPLFRDPAHFKPSVDESIEYSIALNCSDLTNEASRCLSQVDVKQHPKVNFYKAAIHIKTWNYIDAIGYLEEYVKGTISDYERVVGQLNLIAAYIFEQYTQEAERNLTEVKEILARNDWKLLNAITIELEAKFLFSQRKWSEAFELLEKVEKKYGIGKPLNIKKWKTLCQANMNGDVKALHALKEEYKEDYEWLRYIDWWLAYSEGDQYMIDHLYFGTPYSSYKRLIEQDYPISSKFDYRPMAENFIDVISGRDANGPVFKLGSVEHKLFITLTEDFYSPASVGRIFSRCFPNEFFDVLTAPNRVYQAIFRLRAKLESLHPGFEIIEATSGYLLRIPEEWSIRKYKVMPATLSRPSMVEMMIRQKSGGHPFSTKDIMQMCEVSRSSALRLIEELLEQGNAVQVSFGKKSLYNLGGTKFYS